MTTPFSDQLHPLLKIQQIDIQLQKYRAESDQWDSEIDEVSHELQVIDEQLEQLQATRSEHEMDRERLQLEIDEEQERINNYEKRIREITNQREYQALVREVSISKKARGDAEEAAISAMEKIEAIDQEINTIQEQRDAIAANLSNKESSRDEVTDQSKSETEPLVAERKKIAKNVDPKLLTQYNTIRKRHVEVIVPAANETCTGCNRKVPPQMFNQVLRDTHLVNCPACKRMLMPPAPEATEQNDTETPSVATTA